MSVTTPSDPWLPRVLIVEDTEDQALLLATLLGRAGYETERVPSSEGAIARLSRQRFDVVILDILLPGRPGTDVLGFIARIPLDEQPRVLVTTGLPEGHEALRDDSHDLRYAAARMPKPFDPAALLAQVKALVTRP